ncbi:terminase gpP N-terminus-related DNA-binding protein [Bacillus fungorum]|uniref:terminase gpP N-terminus-related DNA-binding protein n=1 Tax=Bacillus fungorum TaxID=2039284 RepID=UPI003F561564
MKQKHELAQEDYMQGMKYKDIAEKHDVSVNTVKSWKTRYKWDRKGVHTNDEKVRTQKKTGAPIGNKNAVGNSGNKNPKWGNKNAVGHGPPNNNKNAVTHGLYATVVYEHLSDEDKRLFDLSQDIEGQEQELQVARFKLAKLMQEQKEHRLKGVAIVADGSFEYKLKDDFYIDAINKALDMISKIETRITKANLEREKLELQKVEHEKKLHLMQAQIDKIRNELKDENPAEDKIGQYLDKLEGAFKK